MRFPRDRGAGFVGIGCNRSTLLGPFAEGIADRPVPLSGTARGVRSRARQDGGNRLRPIRERHDVRRSSRIEGLVDEAIEEESQNNHHEQKSPPYILRAEDRVKEKPEPCHITSKIPPVPSRGQSLYLPRYHSRTAKIQSECQSQSTALTQDAGELRLFDSATRAT